MTSNEQESVKHKNAQVMSQQMEGRQPSQRYIPGESVDEHSKIEAGNILLTGDEIKQQNENL